MNKGRTDRVSPAQWFADQFPPISPDRANLQASTISDVDTNSIHFGLCNRSGERSDCHSLTVEVPTDPLAGRMSAHKLFVILEIRDVARREIRPVAHDRFRHDRHNFVIVNITSALLAQPVYARSSEGSENGTKPSENKFFGGAGPTLGSYAEEAHRAGACPADSPELPPVSQ
jgi:hypothetical protein